MTNILRKNAAAAAFPVARAISARLSCWRNEAAEDVYGYGYKSIVILEPYWNLRAVPYCRHTYGRKTIQDMVNSILFSRLKNDLSAGNCSGLLKTIERRLSQAL